MTDSEELNDLDVFERGGAWRVFDRLREREPVAWTPEREGAGYWSLTRHADILAVARDAETFTSTAFVNLEEVDECWREERRSMLETSGPRHRALRGLVQRAFTQRNLAAHEEFLATLVSETLDRTVAAAASGATIDFVREVAAELPIRMLVRLLDVPDDDAGKLVSWGNRMIAGADPEYADLAADGLDAEQCQRLPFRSPAALEVYAYGTALAGQRRGGNGTDLVSALVNGIPNDGNPLSERDFRTNFLLLVVAGNETTRHALSHAVLALSENPGQWARLRAHPELIPVAVEEFLRWASPVYHFRRTATRRVRLGGRWIEKGDKVVMWYAAGNRDPHAFPRPHRLEVDRTPNDHLSFGLGSPHFCLGARLARMQLRCTLAELVRQVRAIRPAGEALRVRSNFVNGITSLPVELLPAP